MASHVGTTLLIVCSHEGRKAMVVNPPPQEEEVRAHGRARHGHQSGAAKEQGDH